MVYMLLGTGFEETEAIVPLDLLRRAGIPVQTIGITGKTVVGSHSIPITADLEIAQVDPTDVDMVILPGGLGGVASARACQPALDLLRFAWDNGKFVCAICAGPTVLADLGITEGKDATCFPSCESAMGSALLHRNVPCVVTGKLITAASAGCALPFGLALIAALRGKESAVKIYEQIVVRQEETLWMN